MIDPAFSHRRRIHFYETDQMGIVHHSNYLRFFEECRVSWYNISEFKKISWGDGKEVVMAVVETHVNHRSPATFNEEIETRVQVRLEKSKFRFQYEIWNHDQTRLIATGWTLHVPVDQNLKVCKPPAGVQELMKGEVWTETSP